MNAYPNLAPSNPYLLNLVASASPAQLVVLLHDGLIRFLGAAHDGFYEVNPQKRFEMINNNLIRAQGIITELDASLDMERGAEIAIQLHDIYTFFNDALRRVNGSKEPSTIPRIIEMVTVLRDAWSQVINGSPVVSSEASSARQLTVHTV